MDGETEGGAVVFFISFILIVVWTMLPVSAVARCTGVDEDDCCGLSKLQDLEL